MFTHITNLEGIKIVDKNYANIISIKVTKVIQKRYGMEIHVKITFPGMKQQRPMSMYLM